MDEKGKKLIKKNLKTPSYFFFAESENKKNIKKY